MTKRIVIAELEGVALDWAVAVATGETLSEDAIQDEWIFVGAGTDGDLHRIFQPTTDWSQCGPLIERYRVGLVNNTSKRPWSAICLNTRWCEGKTPLIAACRAIVANHNPSGYVEVPDELVEGAQ